MKLVRLVKTTQKLLQVKLFPETIIESVQPDPDSFYTCKCALSIIHGLDR